jgi:PAS domain-containing protein
MAGNATEDSTRSSTKQRALLPAPLLSIPPLLLLLALQLTRPAWLATPWPWLIAGALVAGGAWLFGRYLYHRAVLVGEQLLAANRGVIGSEPFDGDPHGPVQQALALILEEHRRSEAALRASEQRFQLALEASDAYLWEFCLQSGRFTFDVSIGRMFLDEEILTIETAMPPIETAMPLERFAGTIHPDDLPRLRSCSEEFYRSGEFTCEYRCRHRTRGYIWVRCRGRVVERAEDGTPLRALGTICDITDLKLIEERLQSALIAAEDAGHARAQFLAGISHELRTPLNGVLGYAQLLLRDPAVDGERRSYLEALERCGQHLLQLINDIIDLAQIDSGRMVLDESECDLFALLDNVAHVAREQAEAKGLQFEMWLDPALPALVHLDGLKLRQVLHNLLHARIRATEAGSASLQVRRTGDGDARLQFEIRGSGAMPAAQFIGRFGSESGGDGDFGLAVSQRLCRLMGGEIEAGEVAGSLRFSLPCRVGSGVIPIGVDTVAQPAAPVLQPAPLAELGALSSALLEPLRAALALGDLEGLRAALTRLRREVPGTAALVERLDALLEAFDLDQIRALLADSPGSV